MPGTGNLLDCPPLVYSMGSRDEWDEYIESTEAPGYFYAQRWS